MEPFCRYVAIRTYKMKLSFEAVRQSRERGGQRERETGERRRGREEEMERGREGERLKWLLGARSCSHFVGIYLQQLTNNGFLIEVQKARRGWEGRGGRR